MNRRADLYMDRINIWHQKRPTDKNCLDLDVLSLSQNPYLLVTLCDESLLIKGAIWEKTHCKDL